MIDREPIAYFLTYTTFGTWLHGREQGSVDKDHNQVGSLRIAPNPQRQSANLERLGNAAYQLDAPRRRVVLETIEEVAAHRHWNLLAAHVRSNHVHALINANTSPEKILSDLKAWSSRRLSERFSELDTTKRWTRHGSTLYLWSEDQLAEKLRYVIEDQGDVMELYINPEIDSSTGDRNKFG